MFLLRIGLSDARIRRGAASLKSSNRTKAEPFRTSSAESATNKIKVAMILNVLMLLVFIANAAGSLGFEPTRPFDDFGDIKCEDEMARLDNFAVQLQSDPAAKGLIVIYGGRRFRGRLPMQGEADARAARLKAYLVERRGIPRDQVMVVNWGYTEDWHVQLWMVPHGATIPDRERTIPINEIKFRKGKSNPRDFRCRV
jgi:hypothetical protein